MSRIKLFDSFLEIYEGKLSNDKSRSQSFEDATDDYKKKYGFQPYEDNDSFMSQRSKRKRNKR